MQKKKILICSLIIVSILSIFLLSQYLRKEPTSLDEVRLKDSVIIKNNNLAIMLETESDSGIYEEAEGIVFARSGYRFNAELSGCLDMNGLKVDGALTYDDGMAYVEVGSSVYCYLYFDMPPTLVGYLLNEKTRPTSLWTSTLHGDGYRFVGGSGDTTYCAYYGGDHTESLDDPSDSCPTLYRNMWYDETEETTTYTYTSSCSDYADSCTQQLGAKVLPAPNNYICFGTTDKDTCVGNTDLYMYRIIGIFEDSEGNKHLKLIKKEALNTAYAWHSSSQDIDWADSTLYNGINGSYYLSNETYSYMQNVDWTDMITDWTWTAVNTKSASSGVDYVSLTTSQVYYHEMNHANKVNSGGAWTNPNGQIGLIYVSDYMLSLGESVLNQDGSGYNFKVGWIHIRNNDTASLSTTGVAAPKDTEWTIARTGYLDSAYRVFVASSTGEVGRYSEVSTNMSSRPVFYLNSDVLYDSGSGSSTDPFIIYTDAAESELPTYTITGSSNNTNAGTVTVDTPTVEYGGTATWTISVNSGYYYSSNSCGATRSGNTLTLTNITSDTTCTVYFYQYSTTTYYSVTVTSNDTTYGTVSPSGTYSVASGSSKSYTLTPATGYEYKSNTCGGTVSGSTMTISNITSDKSCTVTFGRPDVTITVNSNNTSYGTVSPSSQTVSQGETATFTLTPATGYKYSSNTCGGTVSGNTMTIQQVDATTSCTVTFAKATYKVTLTVDNKTDGITESFSQTVEHGGATTFSPAEYSGYLFSGLSCAGNYGSAMAGSVVTVDNVTGYVTCSVTAMLSAV